MICSVLFCQKTFCSIDSPPLLSIAFLFYKCVKYIWTSMKGWEYYLRKSAYFATLAISRYNSVCLGTSLSMRSFAIDEAPSPLRTLSATLHHHRHHPCRRSPWSEAGSISASAGNLVPRSARIGFAEILPIRKVCKYSGI